VAPEACPTCRGAVVPAAAAFPFCSDRCRLVDLGKWFREDFVASRPLRPEDVGEEE
jgi:endogenous inhibitor of DNA gyrase (YacG/DUF329 family)